VGNLSRRRNMCTFLARCRPISLPNLLCLSFRLPEHQYITRPDRPLDVSSDNSPLVSSFEYPNANLDHFSRHAGSPNDLSHFGGGNRFFGALSCGTHVYALAPLFLSWSVESISSLSVLAPSPPSTTVTAAQPTSIPAAFPSSSLLGTNR